MDQALYLLQIVLLSLMDLICIWLKLISFRFILMINFKGDRLKYDLKCVYIEYTLYSQEFRVLKLDV